MKIAINNRKGGNVAAEFKREKAFSKRREAAETKMRLTNLSKRSICVYRTPIHIKCTLPIGTDKAFVYKLLTSLVYLLRTEGLQPLCCLHWNELLKKS